MKNTTKTTNDVTVATTEQPVVTSEMIVNYGNISATKLNKLSIPNSRSLTDIFGLNKLDKFDPAHMNVAALVSNEFSTITRKGNVVPTAQKANILKRIGLINKLLDDKPIHFTFSTGNVVANVPVWAEYQGNLTATSITPMASSIEYFQFSPIADDTIVAPVTMPTVEELVQHLQTSNRMASAVLLTALNADEKYKNTTLLENAVIELFHLLTKRTKQTSEELPNNLYLLFIGDYCYPIIATGIAEAMAEITETMM